MPTPSPSTDKKLDSGGLADWLAKQPTDLMVYIMDANGEVIGVSDVRVSVGGFAGLDGTHDEPSGVFFETVRTFVPHGMHVLSNTPESEQGRNDQIRQEALARSIESFKNSEFVDNATLVDRANEFYTFLGGK